MKDKELGKVEAIMELTDRGVLALSLRFDFGSGGQSYGGYQATTANLKALLSFFKVSRLEDIKNRYAFALRDKDLIDSISLPDVDGGGEFSFERVC